MRLGTYFKIKYYLILMRKICVYFSNKNNKNLVRNWFRTGGSKTIRLLCDLFTSYFVCLFFLLFFYNYLKNVL